MSVQTKVAAQNEQTQIINNYIDAIKKFSENYNYIQSRYQNIKDAIADIIIENFDELNRYDAFDSVKENSDDPLDYCKALQEYVNDKDNRFRPGYITAENVVKTLNPLIDELQPYQNVLDSVDIEKQTKMITEKLQEYECESINLHDKNNAQLYAANGHFILVDDKYLPEEISAENARDMAFYNTKNAKEVIEFINEHDTLTHQITEPIH